MNLLPVSFQTRDYGFDLPAELIADQPLARRDASRLLVYDRKHDWILHREMKDLPELLDSPHSIVANNTRVFRARLLGERVGTGGKVEFFLLKKSGHPHQPLWKGLMKTGSKVTPGFEFVISGIRARVLSREDTRAGAVFTAEFSKDPVEAGVGEVPLPPYIQSQWESKNLDRSSDQVLADYNTLFAAQEGSVAAPTAGRHFTPELISKLKEKGHPWDEITLHVGLGTFKPVTTTDLRNHEMHAETATISETVASALNERIGKGVRILSVGTTTTRTLEGFARNDGLLESGTRELDLFIYPGSSHRWKIVDSMLTNFHLPESTLLMMISSFIGSRERTLELYQEAIRERYRFYSYGDAMLIL